MPGSVASGTLCVLPMEQAQIITVISFI
jgi:hypothetical protein